MLLKKLLEKLQSSPEFEESRPPQSYLSSFFTVTDAELKPESWELGFYDPQQDRMVTYVLSLDKGFLERKEGAIFKRATSKVHELVLDKVALDFSTAGEVAQGLQKKVYTAHAPSKAVFVLQDLGDGPLWNITFLTHTFHVLNIKVDAITGAVRSHELSTVFQWKQ